MPEYRVTINSTLIRVEAGDERRALYGVLRRLWTVALPSVDRSILVEVRRGEAWELCWRIDRPDVLRRALVSAGVSVTREVWHLDEGRAALPMAFPLTEWKFIGSTRKDS